MKLYLATATHNFKWVKNTPMSLIWDETFADRLQIVISFPIKVIGK